VSLPTTACEIRAGVAAGEVSAVDVCRDAIARIREADGPLKAFLHVDETGALARARQLDREPPADAPLLGVPVALKDNICTAGVPTTAASRVLEHYVPPYSACVVERLERAGAVIIGKTNCDEFAMGSSTEHSAFGPTHNPWDLERIPGGSSGGSAVAVAAEMVPLSLGSETGGSIRQPAALCGVLGLKPTYGRVSRFGLIAFGSSLDQIGPFARTAADLAALLQAIAGQDPRDSTSGVDAGVHARFEDGLRALENAGATIVDVDLPHASLAIPVYYLVANAEASSNLARFDGVRYGTRADEASLASMYYKTRGRFGAEVKRRIMIGTFVLSAGYYDAYYVKAQKVRALIRKDYDEAFEAVDTVAVPTTPTPAFKLGERTDDPLQMYLSDVFTAAANLAGLPAISVPCGLSETLPVGLQLTGRPFDEGVLLRAAHAVQRQIALPSPMRPRDAGSL
jgi:aspartyl-tRNA(Asn)/glutamyl-tRNA(Gln) amidotransferase subunit A